ncbi:hypothetical protein IW261DRAFT_1479783 [Armillaria novae-zelandiae]|uniref:Secreted protein n=1 Tax=Armillaria novae-zelandiae TaxID=153914 RepID=A0AA39UEF1_9AGAR|nr:hypothetical protein IW261DRAFT_1479783 [Armillaria novae-zelandiae]
MVVLRLSLLSVSFSWTGMNGTHRSATLRYHCITLSPPASRKNFAARKNSKKGGEDWRGCPAYKNQKTCRVASNSSHRRGINENG